MTDASSIPLRVLVALTSAVLLAHALVLRYTPLALGANAPERTRAFTTRSLQIKPTEQVTEAAAVKPAIVSPRRPAPTRKRPAREAVALSVPEAAVQASMTAAAPASSETVAQAPDPEATPVALAASEPATTVASAPEQPASGPEPLATAALAPAATAALPKDAAQVARSYTVPGSVRLKFLATGQARKMNYSALGELLWLLRDDRSYEARLELSMVFRSRTIASTGRITADGLEPDRYSDKFGSERASHFDRDKQRIIFSSNAPSAPMQPGAQDELSVFIQLASMIAGEPSKYPPGSTISVQTVGPRSAEVWVFTVGNGETLHLPGGSMEALKLQRNPRKEFDQKVEIWLAPRLGYLPARILITNANGDFVDQQWKSTEAP